MMLQTLARTQVLDNGVTVHIERGWPTSRTAVAWHFPTGFLDDPADAPGLAHLVEHLLFQASSHDGVGDVGAHAAASAGYANGTTHAEYTDFYRASAPEDLIRAIRLDVQRFSRLRFSPAELAVQRHAVGREASARRGRAFGRFPWPLLHERLVNDVAMTRDSFGDEKTLAGVSGEECTEFFVRGYATTRAHVTIVAADLSSDAEDEVLAAIASIPRRDGPPRDPAPARSWLRGRDHVTLVDEHVTGRQRFSAVGLPTPVPDRIAHLILADAVAHASDATAGRGVFGFLDTTRADFAVITPRTRDGGTTMARDRLRARWDDALAHGVEERDWDRARLRLWAELAATAADLTSRARLIGRLGMQHPDLSLDVLAEHIRTSPQHLPFSALWADIDVVPPTTHHHARSEDPS